MQKPRGSVRIHALKPWFCDVVVPQSDGCVVFVVHSEAMYKICDLMVDFG